ncbi:MAG: DUF3108 domain-containing protein [Candidatus Omnitrophica bacterium]|nr:DUF3108 domain-containing protein [Candidatus Omnitrophota bacterium]
MRAFLFLFLLILKSAAAFSAEENCPALKVGERLEFGVSWMGIPVGTGTLEVKEKIEVRGRPAIHLVATARTNDFLSKIYPVSDEIHSFVDAEKWRSLEFRKKLKEGRYRADERIVFDYEKRKGFYESFLNGGKKEMDIPASVQDLLSAFYAFRMKPVKTGDRVHMEVNSEEKNWDLELDVLSREVKELRGGRVMETFKVEPRTRLKGALQARGRAWVYFTADEKKLPVWVTLQTPFGPIVGVLAD